MSNNTFTLENTEDATHIEFIKGKVWFVSTTAESNKWLSDGVWRGLVDDYEVEEFNVRLSRPIGDRKEDFPPESNNQLWDVVPAGEGKYSTVGGFDLKKHEDKPVYTQEASDNAAKPKVGMKCLVLNTLLTNATFEEAVINYMGDWACVYTSESCNERMANPDDLLFKPVDNRTDLVKLRDCLYEVVGSTPKGSSFKTHCHAILASDKFTITLNK